MIRPRLSLALMLSLSLGSACHPTPSTPDKVAPARPSLPALADQISPGQAAPRALFGTLPEPVQREVKRQVPLDAPEDRQLEAAEKRLSRYNIRLGEPAASVGFVEGLLLAETLALRPGPHQLRAATLLVSTHEAAITIFSSLFSSVEAFDRAGAGGASARDPFLPLWHALKSEAASQQSAYAALVLRSSPPDELAIRVMRSVARTQPREPLARLELRRALQQEVIAREGSQATVEEWLELADTHLMLEDAAQAEQALERSQRSTIFGRPQLGDAERAQAMTSAQARRERIQEGIARLHEIRALAQGTTPEQRLHRASLLLASGNVSAARTAYAQLRRELPDDARPVVGLVRADLHSASSSLFDQFFAAKDALQAADRLQNKGSDYYGLMIGLRGFDLGRAMREGATDEARFMARAISTLGELEALNREHARFAPDRAAILGFILQKIRQEVDHKLDLDGVKERLAAYCAEGISLASRYPDTADAFRLSLGCATLLTTDRAFEVALAPLPPSLARDAALAEFRARVLVGLAARHGAAARASAIRAVLEALPTTSDAQRATQATLLADLAATTARKGSWQDAVAAYQKARDLVPASEDARLSSNLAVAQFRSQLAAGRPLDPSVITRLKEAISLARNDREQTSRANLAAIAYQAGAYQDVLDLLQPLLKDDPHVVVRFHVAAAARKLGHHGLAREQARAALDELSKDRIEPATYGGFDQEVYPWAPGTMNFSLNVRSRESTYGLEIGTYYELYLLLPALVSHQEMSEMAAPAPAPANAPSPPKKPAPTAPPRPPSKK